MCDHKAGLPRPARIIEITQESADVKRFVLNTTVEAEPGQFVMVWLPGVNEKPFSLADANPLTLVVARIGPFTTAMHNLQVGDDLWWRGPYGHGFEVPQRDQARRELVLVGGGYGVAPLLLAARRAREAGWPVRVLPGARTSSALFLDDRLAQLQCTVNVCTEDGSRGTQGFVTVPLRQVLQQRRDAVRAVLACGPEGMLEAVLRLCGEERIPCQLSYERLMKCGLGVCGSCARDGLLVCRDGPVFCYAGDGQPANPR